MYSLLKRRKVVRREGIGLGNDGNEIDSRAQSLHDLNVEGLESATGSVVWVSP